MSDDPQTGLQVFHITWTAVTTVLGAIVAFFTKRLVDEVKEKADKCDVDDLKQDIKDFIERQDRQHRDNTARLDQILLNMNMGNRRDGTR